MSIVTLKCVECGFMWEFNPKTDRRMHKCLYCGGYMAKYDARSTEVSDDESILQEIFDAPEIPPLTEDEVEMALEFAEFVRGNADEILLLVEKKRNELKNQISVRGILNMVAKSKFGIEYKTC